MREAVEKVLGAEREAREKIELVKNQAAELKFSADKAAETAISLAREQASMRLHEALDAARKDSARSLDEGKKKAEAQAELWYAGRESELPLWAKHVMDAVLKTDLGKR